MTFERGKRTWTLQSFLTGEIVSAGNTVYAPAVTAVETGAIANPATNPRADDTFYRRAGTVSLPGIRLSANATTGPSTATLMVNGVACGVFVTIPAGVTGWIAGAGTVALSAADGLIWRIVNGGGGALTVTMLSHVFEADTDETVTILRCYSSAYTELQSGANVFMRPAGSRGVDALEANGSLRMPFAATLEALEAKRTGNYFRVCHFDARLRIDGTDGTQALHINPLDQTLQHTDLVHEDEVFDGTEVSLHLTATTDPLETSKQQFEAFSINVVTTNGDHMLVNGAQSGSSMSIPAGTSYCALSGELKFMPTQAAAEAVTPIPLAISRLWLDIRVNNSAASTVLTLLVDGVSTNLLVAALPGVSNDQRDDLHNVIEVPAGSRVCLKSVNAAPTNAVKARSTGVALVEMV